MRYMLAGYIKQEDWDELSQWSDEDLQRMMRYMSELTDALEASGELVIAAGLAAPEQATVVKANGSEPPLVTDGPYTESKEVIAGWWLVDVASYERAVEIAAHVSAAPKRDGKVANAPIEIMPVEGPLGS